MLDAQIPTLTVAEYAAGFSGLMQIMTLLLLGMKMKGRQYLAAGCVSMITGGALAILFIEVWHMNPFVAGAFSSLLGSMPAIFIPFIVMKLAMNRIGLKDTDLTNLMQAMKGTAEGGIPTIPPAVLVIAPTPDKPLVIIPAQENPLLVVPTLDKPIIIVPGGNKNV